MPTISKFYGILIRMFFNDHAPPHFHAEYGEFKAIVNIEQLTVTEGGGARASAGISLRLGKTSSARIA
jgi:hypothetical protein